jgi:hypothetical protein
VENTRIAEIARANEASAKANERAASAEQSAASANERIAQANRHAETERLERIKLEVLVAPRRLSVEQQRAIAKALDTSVGRKVMVKSYASDGEAAILGTQIVESLKAAKLDVLNNLMSQSSFGSVAFGVRVTGNDKVLVGKLLSIFSAIGNLFVLSEAVPPATGMSTSVGDESAMDAIVFVAAKPIKQ